MNTPDVVCSLLRRAYPVMPVLTIEHLSDALPLAQALLDGGVTVLEVTLRTPVALQAAQLIKSKLDITLGVGTVTHVKQLRQLDDIGIDFAISPGLTPELLDAGCDCSPPFIPAIATPSELMQAMSYGYRAFKFFPAQAAGGIAGLQALQGPFAEACFCPTGGVREADFVQYLQLRNVACVGGSWLAPAACVLQKQWSQISALARSAIEQATRLAV